jgi:hypothetical protein
VKVPEQSLDVQRRTVESWFTQQGVPHFSKGYSISDRFLELACLLFAVLAFEVGVAPFLQLTGLELAIAPAVVLLGALTLLPVLAGVLGADIDGAHGSRVRTVVVALAVVFVLVSLGLPFRVDAWVDFSVILLGLLASAALCRHSTWRAAPKRNRHVVVGSLIVATPLFALDGNAFTLASESGTGLVDAPPASPALLLVLLLCWCVHGMGRAARVGETQPGADVNTFALIPAVPLLLIVLSAETAVLRPEQVILPIVFLVAVGLVALLSRLQAPGRASGRVERVCDQLKGRAASSIAVVTYGALFLFTYPAILAIGGSDGLGKALFALGVNAAYLGIVLLVVSFGLEHVANWAGSALLRTRGGIVQGLVRGLPILLLACVFFMLAQELWQVVVEASPLAFCGLLAILGFSTFSLMFLEARRVVNRKGEFESWSVVRETLHTGHSTEGDSVRRELAELVNSRPSVGWEPEDDAGPKRFARLNAIAVVLVYEAFVLVPLAIGATILFWAVAKLAVPADVAGTWVFGDPPAPREDLLGRSFVDEPWTRVALLLAFFSMLYFAAELLKNEEQHEAFFEGAGRGIRQRLAARLVYHRLLVEDETDPAPTTPAPRRATPGVPRSRGSRPSRWPRRLRTS